MAVGHPDDVKEMEADIKKAFACKSEGELKEYVRSNIDLTCNKNGVGTVKVTQHVLVQKLEESFDVAGGRNLTTPALAGKVLVRGDISDLLGPVNTNKFQPGTVICLFMTQWSRSEIFNTTGG